MNKLTKMLVVAYVLYSIAFDLALLYIVVHFARKMWEWVK